MQPSITPRPSARAACAMRIASRIPPDFASLIVIPCATLGADAQRRRACGSPRRRRSATVSARAAPVPPRRRPEWLFDVLDAELRQLGHCVQRLVERPPLVHVHLERQRRDRRERRARAPRRARRSPPSFSFRRRNRPSRAAARRAGPCRRDRRARSSTTSAGPPRQAEQPPGRDAEQLPLQVVQRCIERRLRSLLAGDLAQPSTDVLEREWVVAQQRGVLADKCERGLRRFAVALDRRCLASSDPAIVGELDLDDVGNVLRLARDHERFGELQPDDVSAHIHAANVSRAAVPAGTGPHARLHWPFPARP